MKTCTRCGETKADDQFRKMHGRPGQPCLDCHRKANAEWRKAHPDKMQAARDGWMAVPEHAEHRQAKEHERYLRQRETFNARSVEWRKTNREQYLLKRNEWRKANLSRERRRERLYKLAHPDKVKAIISNWRHNNPDKKREHDERRRANLAGCAVNDFTAKQWRALLEQYGHRCAYCGLKHDKLEQDHVAPLSRGGNHTLSNIVPACKPCNAKKKNRALEDAGMKRRIYVAV